MNAGTAQSKLRGAVLIAASALVLVVAPGAQASAGDDAHVVHTKVSSVPAGALAGQTVTCPAGERAIGGGLSGVGAQAQVSIGSSGPVDETGSPAQTNDGDIPRAWTTFVNNIGSARSFDFYAICSASSDAVVRVSGFTTTGEQGAIARCATGERAIGGGLTSEATATTALELSGPLDETDQAANTNDGDIAIAWKSVVRQSTGVPLAFRSSVVCSATSKATVQAEGMTLSQNTVGQTAAVCPTGQRAIGGGIGSHNGSLGYIGVSTPADANGFASLFDTDNIARGWRADMRNLTGGTESYRVFAVCEAVSAVAPETTITKAPAKKSKRKKPKFEFNSPVAGVTFECSLDKAPFAPCASPSKVKVKKGRHTFAVRAVEAGLADPTPATHNWKRKRKRK